MNRKSLGLIVAIFTLAALSGCSSSDAVDEAFDAVETLDETADTAFDISAQNQGLINNDEPGASGLPALADDPRLPNNPAVAGMPALPDDAPPDIYTVSQDTSGALSSLRLTLPPSLVSTSGSQPSAGESDSSYDFLSVKRVVGFIQITLIQMELDLAFIDQLLPDIRAYCSGSGGGSVCQIPDGVFSFTFTQEYVNSLIEQQTLAAQTFNQLFTSIAVGLGEDPAEFLKEFDDVSGTEAIAELQAMVGESAPLPVMTYSGISGGAQDYVLEQFDGSFSISWNGAFSNILVTTVEQGGDGFSTQTKTTTFEMTRSDTGDIQALLVNVLQVPEGDYSRVAFQLHNDVNNTVVMSIESGELQGTPAATTASVEIRAGNLGGTSVSTVTSAANGEENTRFIIEFFDALGAVVQRESCTGTGVDNRCNTIGEWVISQSGLSDETGIYRANAEMLPDSITAFVVVAAGSDPQQAGTTGLCKGYAFNVENMTGNARCSVPVDELGDVQVFAELYQGLDIVYQLLPTVVIRDI